MIWRLIATVMAMSDRIVFAQLTPTTGENR
jgi:hypothetical protein